MNRRFVIVLVAVLCFGAGVLTYVFRMRLAALAEFEHQVKLGQEEAAQIRAQVIVPTEKRVLARDNFTAALEKFGLSHQDAANASTASARSPSLWERWPNPDVSISIVMHQSLVRGDAGLRPALDPIDREDDQE